MHYQACFSSMQTIWSKHVPNWLWLIQILVDIYHSIEQIIYEIAWRWLQLNGKYHSDLGITSTSCKSRRYVCIPWSALMRSNQKAVFSQLCIPRYNRYHTNQIYSVCWCFCAYSAWVLGIYFNLKMHTAGYCRASKG